MRRGLRVGSMLWTRPLWGGTTRTASTSGRWRVPGRTRTCSPPWPQVRWLEAPEPGERGRGCPRPGASRAAAAGWGWCPELATCKGDTRAGPTPGGAHEPTVDESRDSVSRDGDGDRAGGPGGGAARATPVPQAYAGAAERPVQRGDAFTIVTGAVLDAPNPVPGADNRRHLAYEVRLQNGAPFPVTLRRLDALDRRSGEVLARHAGAALAALVVPPREALHRHHRARAHRLSRARGRAAEARSGAGRPEPPDLDRVRPHEGAAGFPNPSPYAIAPTTVADHRAVVLASPLRGSGWVAVNGCCDAPTSHRGAVPPRERAPARPGAVRDRLGQAGRARPPVHRAGGPAVQLRLLRHRCPVRRRGDGGAHARRRAGADPAQPPEHLPDTGHGRRQLGDGRPRRRQASPSTPTCSDTAWRSGW